MWLGLWLFTTACFTFCGWAMAQQIHELCHARVVRADNSTLAAGCVWFLVTSGSLGIFHDIYSPCKHNSEGLLSQAQHMRGSSFPCVAVFSETAALSLYHVDDFHFTLLSSPSGNIYMVVFSNWVWSEVEALQTFFCCQSTFGLLSQQPWKYFSSQQLN